MHVAFSAIPPNSLFDQLVGGYRVTDRINFLPAPCTEEASVYGREYEVLFVGSYDFIKAAPSSENYYSRSKIGGHLV